MIKFFKKAPLAAGVVIALASGGAVAGSSVTDLNLSAKARAGGMGGAAYTMPQEASAAVFGNPATLTQFKGFNMNFGATLLMLEEVTNTQNVTINGTLNSNKSTSDADNYIVPDFGLTLELAPGLVIGTGLEVDAGLGADYRDDPISLTGGGTSLAPTGFEASLPLLVELISFNANIAGAYQVSNKLSVGAAVTIGFGLMQVGTSGPTTNLGATATAAAAGGPFAGVIGTGAPYLDDFGGTTSSVHDIGFGGSLGATYEFKEGLMMSATVKSPVKYNFRNVSYNGVRGEYEDLDIQQPLEVIVGVALDDILMPGLLVEADLIWKNWSDANTYESFLDDQFVAVVGAQYTVGDWNYRVGYQWNENSFLSNPGNSLGSLNSIGTVPMGGDDIGIGRDVIAMAVQTTLVPTYWEHTVTAGIGYSFTENVSVDAFASYSFSEDMHRSTPTIDGVLSSGALTVSSDYHGEVEAEIMIGAGINVAMP
jgi:long-chain fatty acid transport protein